MKPVKAQFMFLLMCWFPIACDQKSDVNTKELNSANETSSDQKIDIEGLWIESLEGVKNINNKSGPVKWGPISDNDLDKLAVGDTSERIQEKIGMPTCFELGVMLYASVDEDFLYIMCFKPDSDRLWFVIKTKDLNKEENLLVIWPPSHKGESALSLLDGLNTKGIEQDVVR